MQCAKVFARMQNIERRTLAIGVDVDRLIIRCMFDGIRNILSAGYLRDIADVFIVKAQNGQTIRFRQILQELPEGLQDVFHRTIMIHMVIFNIRDHSNFRQKLQKRAITFVSFGYEILPRSEFALLPR